MVAALTNRYESAIFIEIFPKKHSLGSVRHDQKPKLKQLQYESLFLTFLHLLSLFLYFSQITPNLNIICLSLKNIAIPPTHISIL
jgi:hypothetical protein